MFLLPIDSSEEREEEEEQEAASMREMAAVVLVLRTGKNSDVKLFEQAYIIVVHQIGLLKIGLYKSVDRFQSPKNTLYHLPPHDLP